MQIRIYNPALNFFCVLVNVSDPDLTGSGFSWVCESGFCSMRRKWPTQKRKEEDISSVGCSLLRAVFEA
jgi:hypothetical protein